MADWNNDCIYKLIINPPALNSMLSYWILHNIYPNNDAIRKLNV